MRLFKRKHKRADHSEWVHVHELGVEMAGAGILFALVKLGGYLW